MSSGAYPGHTYKGSYQQKSVRDRQRRLHHQNKRVVFWWLGDCCQRCGETDPDVLHVDHVRGAVEPPGHSQRRGSGLYNAIVTMRRDLTGLRLTCANCNARKKIRRREVFGYKQRRGLVPV